MYRFPKEGTTEYKLQNPFQEDEIEWRPQSGEIKDGKPRVRCMPFVKKHSIECRLDEVFRVTGWIKKYRHEQGDIIRKESQEKTGDVVNRKYEYKEKGVICILSVYVDGREISKEDGAPETDFESFKGGCTDSFKRVASSGYGIGRYLYRLKILYASECSLSYKAGWAYYRTKTGQNIWWAPPKLPSWALPKGDSNSQGNSDSSKPKGYQMKPAAYCDDCKAGITEGVKKVSESKYNKTLCMNCQSKRALLPYAGIGASNAAKYSEPPEPSIDYGHGED